MTDDTKTERKALADQLRAEATNLDAPFVGSSDRTLSIGQIADEIEQGTELGLDLFQTFKVFG